MKRLVTDQGNIISVLVVECQPVAGEPGVLAEYVLFPGIVFLPDLQSVNGSYSVIFITKQSCPDVSLCVAYVMIQTVFDFLIVGIDIGNAFRIRE